MLRRSLIALLVCGCGTNDPSNGDAAVDSAPANDSSTLDAADGAPSDGGSDALLDADAAPPPFTPFARAYGSLLSTPNVMEGAVAGSPSGEWLFGSGIPQGAPITIGNSQLMPGAFLARVDPDANVVFAKSFPLVNPSQGHSALVEDIVADPGGGAVAVGTVHGGIDVDGLSVGSPGTAAFIIKVDATGKKVFTKGIQSSNAANSASARAVTVDPAGNFYVALDFGGTLDFGGGNRTLVGNGIAIVKYDASGAWKWDKIFGTSPGAHATSITFGSAGVTFGGSYNGPSMNLGSGALPDTTTYNAIYCTLDATTGSHLFDRVWGTLPGGNIVSFVRDLGGGELLVAGGFEGTIDFGKGNLTSAGGSDVFVARIDASHATTWVKRFGDAAYQYGPRGFVDAKGGPHIFGHASGTISFGATDVTLGSIGIYTAVLDANGLPLSARGWPNARAIAMARDPWDRTAYFGAFSTPLTFPSGTLNPPSNNNSAFFLATGP